MLYKGIGYTTYGFRNLGGNYVNMGFPCDILINNYAPRSKIMKSINSPGNSVGMKCFFGIGMKNSPFDFISINREFIRFKSSKDYF